MRGFAFVLAALVAGAAALVLGTFNSGLVEVDLLFVQLETTLGAALVGSLALGLILGAMLVYWIMIVRLLACRRRNRKLMRERGEGLAALPENG